MLNIYYEFKGVFDQVFLDVFYDKTLLILFFLNLMNSLLISSAQKPFFQPTTIDSEYFYSPVFIIYKQMSQSSANCKEAQTKQSSFIGHYHEAPTYMKDNVHITHGYRINFDSPRKIFRSLFMVHNESVNIWSHFLPAMLLIALIIYLLIFVGPTNIIHDFKIGKQKITSQIQSYSEALNNFTFIIKMKQIKSETDREVEQLKKSIFNSYVNFQQQLQTWKGEAQSKLTNIQKEVKISWNNHLLELESLKQDFQKIFVPNVVNNLKDKIDSEYLETLSKKLMKIKEDIDSSTYDYIEILHHSGPNLHEVSRWPVFVMLFSAIICLSCSSLFHLFYPMSGRAYQMFSRLDYAGINVLIVGSSFPAVYYGMYCSFSLVIFYLIIISALGLSLFIVSLFQYLHREENLKIKSLCYGGFGVSLSIPLIHIVINSVLFNNYGDPFTNKDSVGYYLLCGFFYLFGLYIYTVRFPERKNPGKFNTCGNSHQIWHVFVILGILATYMGALQDFETRKYCMCPSLN